MKIFISALIVISMCGCSGEAPKNHAVRTFPAEESMLKWTDFEGDYRLQRVVDGRIQGRHRMFFNESLVASNAIVKMHHRDASNIVVSYETKYDGYWQTNVIEIGKNATKWGWIWTDGVAIFLEKYYGHGIFLPGIVYGEKSCTIEKNQDASLTIRSSVRKGGKFFWIRRWEEPVDCSVVRLVPVEP